MQAATSSVTAPKIPTQKKYSPNKFYVLGIIAGILIVAPAAAYLMLSHQLTQNNISQISSVDVTPKTQITITESEIDQEMKTIWGSYYTTAKNNPKLRAAAKENLMRQKLINQGLSKNHISTSSVASSNQVEENLGKEDILKQKVLNSRTADYAFVFIDPSSTHFQANKDQITYSYTLLKRYIADGKTMQEAYDIAKKDPKFFKGITITNDKLLYQNSMDKTISQKLFTYTTGQTSDIIDSGGGTFVLAHITSSNPTKYATINDWLTAQEKIK